MIVVDASVLVEALLRFPAAPLIYRRLLQADNDVHAPHLIDIEVAQTVRKHLATGAIDRDRAQGALQNLKRFPLQRHAHTGLLSRIWTLRNNLTAYDAAYVALAESLGAALLTRDRRMAGAPGHFARIELV